MPVCVLEPFTRLHADVHGLSDRQPIALPHQLRDRRPLDVLHHDEVAVRLRVVSGVVHLDHVGVDQLCGRERLPPEPRQEAVVLGQVLGQQLDGDLPLQDVVARAVDGRHAAGSETLVEPVPPRYLESEHGHRYSPPPGTTAPPSPVTPVLPSCPVTAGAVLPVGGWSSFCFFGFLSFLPLPCWSPPVLVRHGRLLRLRFLDRGRARARTGPRPASRAAWRFAPARPGGPGPPAREANRPAWRKVAACSAAPVQSRSLTRVSTWSSDDRRLEARCCDRPAFESSPQEETKPAARASAAAAPSVLRRRRVGRTGGMSDEDIGARGGCRGRAQWCARGPDTAGRRATVAARRR